MLLAIGGCADPSPPPTPVDARASDPAPTQAPLLEPVQPSTPPTLLDHYLDREAMTDEQWRDEARHWTLPRQSLRLDAALFIGVARADIELVELVLAPHATYGLPDMRMLGERPIFGDEGPGEFLRAFQRAAQRFPERPETFPKAAPPGIEATFATGAEPMWTVLKSPHEDTFDDYILIRKIVFRGQPRIDYVGFWKDGPPKETPRMSARLGLPPPRIPPMDKTVPIPEGMLLPPQ